MITIKIKRLDDDPTERGQTKRSRGSAAEERAAMAALARSTGRSLWHVKTRARRPGRGSAGGKGKAVARPRHVHKKDWLDASEYLIGGDLQADGSRSNPDGVNRVEDAFALNCPIPDGERLDAAGIREMSNWMAETAAGNSRIRASSVLHYVVGLPPEESHHATAEFWRDIAPRYLQALDMEEHQALCVAHQDAEHPHMHILVNRVHPTTYRAHSPFQDLVALEALTRQIEKERGLRVVPGRLIDPKTGKKYTLEQIRKGARPARRHPSAAVNEFKRVLKEDKPFTHATGWADLEQRLTLHGFHLEAEGAGLMIVNGESQAVKVSAVAGKGNGRRKLAERFGYDWNDYQADKTTAKNQGISIEDAAAKRQAETQRQAAERQAQQQRQAEAARLARRRQIEALLKGEGVWFAGSSVPGEVALGGQHTSEGDFKEIAKELSETELRTLHVMTTELRDRMAALYAEQESLHVSQRRHDTFDIKGVLSGSKRALQDIENRARDRGIDLVPVPASPAVDTPDGASKTEPVRLDIQDLSAAEAKTVREKWIKTLMAKPGEIEAVHKATKSALAAVAELPSQQEQAKQRRLLKDGLSVIEATAKRMTKENPYLQFSFVKTKAAQRQRGGR